MSRAPRSTSLLQCLPFLALGVLACAGDTSAPPPPVATTLQASGTLASSGTVGAAVPTAPAVRAVSATGTPVAGVNVTFAITAGSGTLGATSATTGSDGIASAGSWTLGTQAGANGVTATASGLAPVQFNVTGTAGAAASIAVSTGDAQSAAVGADVATPPAVILRDQYANPVSGAAVAFAVQSGGGSVTGGAATTGADGIAKLTAWTLGIANGAQQLKASSGALSVTINATATIPAGCTPIKYAIGASLPLAWDAADCTSGGNRYDRLEFTTKQQEEIDAQVDGANGRQLFLRRGDFYVGRQPSTAFSPVTQTPMHLKYVLAPGSYVFEPYAPDATTTGSYSFSTTANTKIDCDYIIFASTNVTINGTVDESSCVGPFNGREQWINLQLKTGTKVRITLSGTDDVPFLVFRDDRLGAASPTLATARGTAAGEAVTVNWTATFDTWHEIVVTSLNGLLGKYTLKIEELP